VNDKPIYVIREGSFIKPATEMDEELLREIPPGRQFVIHPKKPSKSSRQLRLYWALLNKVVKARQDARFPTAEKLSKRLLVETGRTNVVWRFDGGFDLVPDSIAAMTRDEFNAYFNDAMPLVRDHVLGIDKESFDRFIADIADVIGMERSDLHESSSKENEIRGNDNISSGHGDEESIF
jgi:hypothetical protein